MIESIMREATDRLQKRGINAQIITESAVVDADVVAVQPDGTIQNRPDGKLDPNPDRGTGSEAGRATIYVYGMHADGHGAAPVLIVDEIFVADSGMTEAKQLVKHILDQLGN